MPRASTERGFSDREHDRRRRDRPREQLGVFDAVVRSRVVHVVAVQEGTDDLDGLFEHGAPFGRAGPSLPHDMLAEPLSAAEPEEESAFEHRRDRRGRVRHHHRMHSNDRSRNTGPETQVLSRGGNPADHAPKARPHCDHNRWNPGQKYELQRDAEADAKSREKKPLACNRDENKRAGSEIENLGTPNDIPLECGGREEVRPDDRDREPWR